MNKPSEFLYEQIADIIEAQIKNQVLKAGHKLPSVRMLCKQHQVSPSTVFNAYYRLEAMGLIEAKPKSGYYVKNLQTQARFDQYQAILPTVPQNIQPLQPTVSDLIDDIEQMNQHPDFITFAQATPHLRMLPQQKLQKSVSEVLKIYPDQWLDYAPSQGVVALRTQILLHTLQWGFKGNMEDVLITAGCLEAVSICLQSVTQPGDLIITEDLTYFGIQQLIGNLNLQVLPLSIQPNQGFDLDHLEHLFKTQAIKACLFTSNFHNPTAHSIPDSQKESLATLAAHYHVPIIEDDVYGEIYFGKQRPATIKRYDKQGWVMYCTSFSKMLSPGFRLGYCLPGRFQPQVTRQKRIHSLATSSLTQYALSRFLEKGRFSYHLKKLRRELYFNMLKYEQCIINSFPKATYFLTPQGGYVFWIGFDKNLDTYPLYLKSKAQQICVVPGHLFSLHQQYKNFIRLSFANPFDADIATALATLGNLLD